MKSGIYIHIPFCKKKCSYCAFVSGNFSHTEEYFEMLKRELEEFLPKSKPDTLYIGGGTPSFVGLEKIKSITSMVNSGRKGKIEETTIEMNPDSVSEELVKGLINEGINRFSLGVQSTDNVVLKRLGRVYSKSAVFKAMEILRKHSKNISIDIIWGIPERKADLSIIDIFKPEHVSTYLLTIEPETKFFNDGFKQKSDKFVEREYYHILEFLYKRKYLRYEVSNFSIEGYQSKHNLLYWNTENVYYGFGVSACSYYNSIRSCNTQSYEKYIKDFKADRNTENIDLNTSLFEKIMLGMRKTEGIKEEGECYAKINHEAVSLQIERGYLIRKNGRIYFSDAGFLIMNGILADIIKD